MPRPDAPDIVEYYYQNYETTNTVTKTTIDFADVNEQDCSFQVGIFSWVGQHNPVSPENAIKCTNGNLGAENIRSCGLYVTYYTGAASLTKSFTSSDRTNPWDIYFKSSPDPNVQNDWLKKPPAEYNLKLSQINERYNGYQNFVQPFEIGPNRYRFKFEDGGNWKYYAFQQDYANDVEVTITTSHSTCRLRSM